MAIGNDKTRTALTIEKDFKSKIEKLAKEDERSLNSFIIKILKDYVKNSEKKADL